MCPEMGTVITVILVLILCCHVSEPRVSKACGPLLTIARDDFNNWTFPASYDNSSTELVCNWTIKAEDESQTIYVENTDEVTRDGYLCIFEITAYDGPNTTSSKIKTWRRWCNHPRAFTSSGRYLTLQIDDFVFEDLMKFNFRFKQTSGNQICKGDHQWLNALETPAILTSPGYPNNYSRNHDCTITFNGMRTNMASRHDNKVWNIEVRFIDMDMAKPPCASEFVRIHDGIDSRSPVIDSVCGSSLQAYASSGISLTLRFKTDGNTPGRGFKLMYRTVARYPDRIKHRDYADGSYTNRITLWYDTNTYKSHADYTWRVNGCFGDVVTIEFEILDMEDTPGCSGDYIEAFDGYSSTEAVLGKWCGVMNPKSPVKVQSSGQFLFLKFHSDGIITTSGPGFKLNYDTLPKPAEAEPFPVVKVVGFILAGVIFLIVVVVFCIMCRRKDNTRSQESADVVQRLASNTETTGLPPPYSDTVT